LKQIDETDEIEQHEYDHHMLVHDEVDEEDDHDE